MAVRYVGGAQIREGRLWNSEYLRGKTKNRNPAVRSPVFDTVALPPLVGLLTLVTATGRFAFIVVYLRRTKPAVRICNYACAIDRRQTSMTTDRRVTPITVTGEFGERNFFTRPIGEGEGEGEGESELTYTSRTLLHVPRQCLCNSGALWLKKVGQAAVKEAWTRLSRAAC